ncbi:CoA transferase [Aeromicrobium sp. UC242_57]|uniref:CoA transferase n=1 Tax=Aeromicrobium sp. UC242_57 TaxID=3374624 RepID=UPI0037A1AE90
MPDRDDRARCPALRDCLATQFASRTEKEWTEVFESTDAGGPPVVTIDEAASHPHLVARAVVVQAGRIRANVPCTSDSEHPNSEPSVEFCGLF